MSDLEPISIPFGGSKLASNSTPAEEVIQTVTPETAERVWVTEGEVDRYVGRPLVEVVESGDQLVHKLFEAETESTP